MTYAAKRVTESELDCHSASASASATSDTERDVDLTLRVVNLNQQQHTIFHPQPASDHINLSLFSFFLSFLFIISLPALPPFAQPEAITRGLNSTQSLSVAFPS